MTLRRLWAILVKELRQLRRDRMTAAMIVGIPVIQLTLFGFAINTNVRGLDAGIADQANTAGSRALVMDMLATEVVTPKYVVRTPQELVALLRAGRISVGVVVPPDFERRKAEGREAVQVMVDGSDTAVQSAAAQIAQHPARQAENAGQRDQRQAPERRPEDKAQAGQHEAEHEREKHKGAGGDFEPGLFDAFSEREFLPALAIELIKAVLDLLAARILHILDRAAARGHRFAGPGNRLHAVVGR